MFTLHKNLNTSVKIFLYSESLGSGGIENKQKGEDTRFKEIGGGSDSPIDGSEVDDLRNQNKDKEKQKEDRIKPIDVSKQIDTPNMKEYLSAQVKQNPDLLAIQDRGPEAIKQAGLEVQGKGWPC